jgi:hypothetical protein
MVMNMKFMFSHVNIVHQNANQYIGVINIVGIFSHACFFVAISKVNMPFNEARVSIAVLTSPTFYKILLCKIVPWVFLIFSTFRIYYCRITRKYYNK